MQAKARETSMDMPLTSTDGSTNATPGPSDSTPPDANTNTNTSRHLSKVVSRVMLLTSLAPPLPLIRFPSKDFTEFEVPTRSGFSYEIPELELPDVDNPTVGADKNNNPVCSSDAAQKCKLLSDFMTENETSWNKKQDTTPHQIRLVYKRIKSSQAAVAAVIHPQNVPNTGSSPSVNSTSVTGSSSSTLSSPRTLLSNDDSLEFHSFFECGNLDRAYRVIGRDYNNGVEHGGSASLVQRVDQEYDLYCDCDVHTQGHIQWYYFRVKLPSKTIKPLRVRFNIRNMQKRASLYNLGMQPAVYTQERGWHHAGESICYFRNTDTYCTKKAKNLSFYTLSFVYEFTCSSPLSTNEKRPIFVYFAHCYPYSYTKLQKYLLSLQRDPQRNQYFRRRVLCKTIAGNLCSLITITEFGPEEEAAQRQGIVLTARVHPGESNSSFILHGILDFLTGDSMEARFLRHHFVFKIIPMLNPDGVIHGNYRCSLAACDLNRRWLAPTRELHPTIHAAKSVVLALARTRGIALFCDIHGHSKKKNMFLYCCKRFSKDMRREAAEVRLFPFILSKSSVAAKDGFFSYEDCRFSVTASKKSTGRVVVWNEGRVLQSFTLESSFFGWENALSNQPLQHFTSDHLIRAGHQFCMALIPFQRVLGIQLHPVGVSPPPLSGATPDENQVAPTSTSISTITAEITSDPGQSREQVSSTASTDEFSQTPPEQPPATSSSSGHTEEVEEDQDLGAHACGRSHNEHEVPQLCEAEELMVGSLEGFLDTASLMNQLEHSLPGNLDELEDKDSDGSESDPSGDNMEPEELQRNSLWNNVQEVQASSVIKLPKLAKIRMRRSLGQEGFQLIPSLAKPLLPLQEPKPAQEPPTPHQPASPSPAASATSAATPVATTKAVEARPRLRRTRSTAAYEVDKGVHGHLTCFCMNANGSYCCMKLAGVQLPNDRNGEIAMMHLRVVQRRFERQRTRDSRRNTPRGTPPNEPATAADAISSFRNKDSGSIRLCLNPTSSEFCCQ